MHQVILTMVGNVVADPQLRQTRNGTPVASFRLASTSRRYDQQAGGYVSGETLYIDVQCWRGLARHAAQVLSKGSPVIVHGRLRARPEPASGSGGRPSRDPLLLDAFSIGLDLARLPLVDADPGELPVAREPSNADVAA
jgi:single-strand DNA-binding protein